MSNRTSIHIDEDLLERYALARPIEEAQLELLEEHLLVCPRCQVRLEKLDAFSLAAKTAAQKIAESAPQPVAKPIWPGYAARAAMLAFAASLAIFVFVPKQAEVSSEPVTVSLVSARDESRIEAPAQRTLRFQLDLTGLESLHPAIYEVLSAEGELIYRRQISQNEANPPLAAGRYWVRLKAENNGATLREFALQVR